MEEIDSSGLLRRQTYEYEYYCDWWSCSTAAFVVKWVIVGIIVLIFVGWFLGGYIHAKRRMKKGLPPLAYHRFLVSRRERARFAQTNVPQNNVAFYDPQTGRYGPPPNAQAYPMQPWAPPPPAYHDQNYVPPYPGTQGGSKVNPDQNFSNPELAYSAPSGPPPPQAPPQAASTIRELDNTNSARDVDRLNSPGPAAGPSRSLQPTVETMK